MKVKEEGGRGRGGVEEYKSLSKAEYMFMLVRLWVWVGHVLGLLATVFTCASTTNKATKQIPLSVSKTLLVGQHHFW